MLYITFLRTYIQSKTGNTVFVYEVTGPEEAMNQYKEIQGDKLVIDEITKKVLWFTTRGAGMHGKLIITSNNNIVADDSEMKMAESLAKQYPSLASEIGKQAINKSLRNKSVAQQQPDDAEPSELGDLSKE